MNNKQQGLPIGVFDSGVGGVSVLAQLLKQLPQENYLYYADSKHAPYGVQSIEQVRKLTLEAVDFLCNKGIKALVVACNTATSVAVRELRTTLNIPVIGMEPAVKPAVAIGQGGKILVMATPLTLSQPKFNSLLHRFEDQAEIIPLPCPGLVELIEKGETSGPALQQYLRSLLAELKLPNIAAIVLGCTHYIFIRQELAQLTGPGVVIVDGNCGTAKHLANVLAEQGLLRTEGSTPQVSFYTSGESEQVIPLCQELLSRSL